jgi:hypothetical protein
MAQTTIVFMRCGDLKRPVLKVTERHDDVVSALRSGGSDEHLSLHREEDGRVILLRVEVARKLGYRDPERHGTYVEHRPLSPSVQGADGHLLVGRRITIESAKPKAKYERADHIVIDTPAARVHGRVHPVDGRAAVLGTRRSPRRNGVRRAVFPAAP